MRRLLLPLTLLLAALACNFPGFGPSPAPTPRPTPTPTATFAPIGGGPATATPDASLAATMTPTQPDLSVTASPTPTALITDTPTPTATQPFVFATATPQPPLNITNILLEQVIKDETRPNGAIAKIKIEFSGGKPPFTFYDEGLKQKGNPVDALTSCGATLVHTVRVDSADGQTDSQAYYFSPINCPP